MGSLGKLNFDVLSEHFVSPDLFGGVGDAKSVFASSLGHFGGVSRNFFTKKVGGLRDANLHLSFVSCDTGIWCSRAFLMFSTSGLVITDNSLVSDAGCELDTPSS